MRPCAVARRSLTHGLGRPRDHSTARRLPPAAPGVTRYMLTCQYEGTAFHGWEGQPASTGLLTVQGALEKALGSFYGSTGAFLPLAVSSRTDAGVHALKNVLHVDVLPRTAVRSGTHLPPHSPARLCAAVNSFLGDAPVSITAAEVVDPSLFHARFSAVEREYIYHICTPSAADAVAAAASGGLGGGGGDAGGDAGRDAAAAVVDTFGKRGPPLLRQRAWFVPHRLDVPAMQAAAACLLGTHDFSSFRSSKCAALSPVRTLSEVSVAALAPPAARFDDPPRHPAESGQSGATAALAPWPSLDMLALAGMQRVMVRVRAPSFLMHQVRHIVGALHDVGRGKVGAEHIRGMLRRPAATAAREAVPSGRGGPEKAAHHGGSTLCAPACGLYLVDVRYNGTGARAEQA
jgi:tRNA pseudouridine38-40 synthase